MLDFGATLIVNVKVLQTTSNAETTIVFAEGIHVLFCPNLQFMFI